MSTVCSTGARQDAPRRSRRRRYQLDGVVNFSFTLHNVYYRLYGNLGIGCKSLIGDIAHGIMLPVGSYSKPIIEPAMRRKSMLDWFIDTPWALWLVIAILLALIEVLSLDLVFLMFSVAALVTSASTPINQTFIGQCIVFCVVGVLLVFILRPRLLARLNKNTPENTTNVAALLGQEVEVVQAVTADGGLVRLEGDIWSARSTLGTIPAGGKARVVEIDGATAIVGTIQEQPLLP